MKRSLRILLLPLFFLGATTLFNSSQAQQKGNNFGIGFMVGEPTGVSVKKWVTDNSAFDVGAAWSLSDKTEALHLHADFLNHNWFNDQPSLAFYYGIGVRTILDNDPKIGVRVPIGLNYVFENIPFDVFVEAVPIFDLVPDTEFAGNGAFGMRFYF